MFYFILLYIYFVSYIFISIISIKVLSAQQYGKIKYNYVTAVEETKQAPSVQDTVKKGAAGKHIMEYTTKHGSWNRLSARKDQSRIYSISAITISG